MEIIAKKANSDLGKEIILSAEPTDNIFQLQREHNLVEETTQLLLYDDELPIEGLSDVRSKLYKAQIENSVLSTTELLTVKDLYGFAACSKDISILEQKNIPIFMMRFFS